MSSLISMGQKAKEASYELGGKYLNDSRNNINWSLDYPDFTH